MIYLLYLRSIPTQPCRVAYCTQLARWEYSGTPTCGDCLIFMCQVNPDKRFSLVFLSPRELPECCIHTRTSVIYRTVTLAHQDDEIGTAVINDEPVPVFAVANTGRLHWATSQSEAFYLAHAFAVSRPHCED